MFFLFQLLFREDLIVQFLTVFLQVLVHRSHDLGRDATALIPACSNMAAMYTVFRPLY